MKLTTCKYCGTNVLPNRDGTCPSCTKTIVVGIPDNLSADHTEKGRVSKPLIPQLPRVEEIDYSGEFGDALDYLLNAKRNVFITGRAGTGKSTLLQLLANKAGKRVVLLSFTGLSAINIGGMTIHSFFKFPPRPLSDEDIVELSDKSIYSSLNTFIIDEISMVRADLMDAMDLFMRKNGREPSLPFGGCQVMIFGDVYQLQPVVEDQEETEYFSSVYKSPFFFDSKVFQQLDFSIINLSQVFRQKDPELLKLLDLLRTQEITRDQLSIINRQVKTIPVDPSKDSDIHLVTTNRRAAEINGHFLDQIYQPMHIYTGVIEGKFHRKTLPTDLELKLKVGAQVMFVKNDSDHQWVNGTIGIVEELFGDYVRVNIEQGALSHIVNVPKVKWENIKVSFNHEERTLGSEVIGSFSQIVRRQNI